MMMYSIILVVLLNMIVTVLPSDIPSSLPLGWTAHNHDGKIYYYNHHTGTSQWNKPDHHNDHQQPHKQQQLQPLQQQQLQPLQQQQQPQQLNVQSQPVKTLSSSSIRYNKKSRSNDVSNERLFKELKGADKRIDDLNNMIDALENEKETLSTRLTNETALRLSIEANYTDINNKYIEIQLANTDTINKLKELTLSIEKEIEEKDKITVELALWQSKFGNDTELLNTPTDMRLRKVIKALKDKNKELMDAYEEIGKLEADLQNVAGTSIRRLRRPSFLENYGDIHGIR